MLPSSNPYNWHRVNPDLFYGRENLASNLVHGLVNGRSFGITGGRRMGKTTLLRRVEKDLLSHAAKAKGGGLLVLPVYIETLALPSMISADCIYQEIARLVSEKLNKAMGAPLANSESVNAIKFTTYLRSIVELMTDYRPQIIFLFDEIEPIIKADWGRSFFANWRSLLHNTPDIDLYLSAAFTGASEMYEIARDIGSPLANILDWLELELFSMDDTANLMCEPSQYNWHDSFVKDVYDLTGGHPFLVQYVMQVVCNYDVQKASQALHDAKLQFLNKQKTQFHNWWDKFDNTTRTIYARLTNSGVLLRKTIFSEFGNTTDRKLSILAHTGVIRIDWETDTIMTAGSLFREWFTRFGIIEVTPTFATQVDSLLKELERQLRQLLSNYLNKKYKLSWLQERIKKQNPKMWKDILRYSKKPSSATLNNNEVLKNLNLCYLFELVCTEWSDLGGRFTKLSNDSNKAKSRLEERKEHLVFVRNKLRHVNESDLTPGDLLKAQAFCTELLESLL